MNMQRRQYDDSDALVIELGEWAWAGLVLELAFGPIRAAEIVAAARKPA